MIDASVWRPQSGKDSSSPLVNWANDDLLLTERARLTVAEAYPRAFRILDWALLRKTFEKHDISAKQAKLKINRYGLRGTLLSAVGASLLPLTPLFPTGVPLNAIIVTGCCLIFVGGLTGLWHLLGHSGRASWLLHRVWTERLRQFYFQYIINNFEAGVAALGADAEIERYKSSRDGALMVFIDDLEQNLAARSFTEAIRWLADDHDDIRAWGQNSWHVNRVLPSIRMTDSHWELLECLSRSRIGTQEIYAQLNLKPQSPSQSNMARRIVRRGNVATFIFVVSLALAGMSILVGLGHEGLSSDILIALSGVAAAWGLYFRLVDQGMGYSLDAERYELYVEQVALVRQRFNAAADDVHHKITALRQLEIYAYREMRQFLRTHLRSRFLG